MIDKAITIRAPWSLAVAAGRKTVENRVRRVNYRGPIAVHVGAAWCRVGGSDDRILAWWWGTGWRRHVRLDATDFAYAMRRVVAVTNIVGCHRAEPRCCWSQWADQPTAEVPVVWHVELADTVRLDAPVGPVKGRLSVPWTLPEDIAAKLRDQLDADTLARFRHAATICDPVPQDLAGRTLERIAGEVR